ncbi:hypothetical protein ACFLQ1_02205, partial [Candidatus Auribacterota bacterium]
SKKFSLLRLFSFWTFFSCLPCYFAANTDTTFTGHINISSMGLFLLLGTIISKINTSILLKNKKILMSCCLLFILTSWHLAKTSKEFRYSYKDQEEHFEKWNKHITKHYPAINSYARVYFFRDKSKHKDHNCNNRYRSFISHLKLIYNINTLTFFIIEGEEKLPAVYE